MTEKDLEKSQVCPHCNFRPSVEQPKGDGSRIIDQLDDHLDDIITNWTQTLLDSLEDPIIQNNLGLLKSDEKEIVDQFINTRSLPDPLDSDFVHAVKQAVAELKRVNIKLSDLSAALQKTGGAIHA